MMLRNFNINSLLVFAAVYRHQSMTLAAKEMAMTQPGVTQHIRNLEEVLKVKLFERAAKKLIPSKEAEVLYSALVESIENLENVLSTVAHKDRKFMGTVRIGVPIEFGNAKVLPHLPAIREQYPDVQFHITYGMPLALNNLLMEGKLDFAFIDQYQMNPSIKTKVVTRENLILCCSEKYAADLKLQKMERQFFESLSYIEYQPGELILRSWFERAYGFKKMKLSVASYSFDVQGIAALLKNDMGVGVLPEHVYKSLLQQGEKLFQFRPKKGAVSNPISLAYLDQRWNVPLNQYVIKYLTGKIVQ